MRAGIWLIGALRRSAALPALCALVRHQALDHSGQRVDEPAQVLQLSTDLRDLSHLLCHRFKLRPENRVNLGRRAV